MRFSDYLQPGDEPEGVAPGMSGPDPEEVGAEVMELFDTIEGDHRVPDPKKTEAEVQEMVRTMQLSTAAIRGERLLKAPDAAVFLGLAASTLKEWRDQNINLPYYVSPAKGMYRQRRIYYRLIDLVRYREFVLSHFTPDNVQLPPPGTMGTPFN